MGVCLSTSKVSGSNSSNNNNNRNNANHCRKEGAKPRSPPPKNKDETTRHVHVRYDTKHRQEQHNQGRNNQQQQLRAKKDKATSRRQTGVIPCGKRTDFGYDKDFDKKYSIGKLLGHGQFGYTYVAIDKSTGDRVAVKKIDKSKVILLRSSFLYLYGWPIWFNLPALGWRIDFYWWGIF